jgi:hypothetical protein
MYHHWRMRLEDALSRESRRNVALLWADVGSPENVVSNHLLHQKPTVYSFSRVDPPERRAWRNQISSSSNRSIPSS